eukprot:TRINITY_DN2931_c0_g1_i1.p3 TRINITY_DN2931_c0_g1~~TRINITY_DN2931_c0_g1_i1.p3  ORF type:complete len:114 (+),score=21.14 TRINITY_DN2931_c0_g1_i1:64-405(+)
MCIRDRYMGQINFIFYIFQIHKKMEEPQINTNPQIEPDLECNICCELLYKPSTINCGHSFCKECLIRSLQQKPVCPMCRTPCFVQENYIKENITLRNLICSCLLYTSPSPRDS